MGRALPWSVAMRPQFAPGATGLWIGGGHNGIIITGGQVAIQPRLTCGFLGAIAVHIIAPLTANYGPYSCTELQSKVAGRGAWAY